MEIGKAIALSKAVILGYLKVNISYLILLIVQWNFTS